LNSSSMPRLLDLLQSHDRRARRSLNFTPSENVLSPLARMPFVMDTYSRYFFEHMRLFGEWFFFSGIEAGLIQAEVLEPLLRELAHAQYVDTRPISGLNCMTVAMAGLCRSGGTMLTVPAESGGHMSTTTVAARLGIRTLPIPMSETHFVDLDGLDRLLAAERPDLIYIDQSNQLFPIDPKPIREVVDLRSPRWRPAQSTRTRRAHIRRINPQDAAGAA
jgi:glycine hydroxymethyltransferase